MKIILYIFITSIVLVQGCKNDGNIKINPKTDTLITSYNLISKKLYLQYNFYFDSSGNVFEREIFDSKRYIYSTTKYYNNHKVRLKGQKATSNKIPFGIWKYYTFSGTLLKQVNWDTLYKISVCDAFAIAKNNGLNSDSTEISYLKDSSNHEYWYVGQDNSSENKKSASENYWGLKIDCKTGKFEHESVLSDLDFLSNSYKFNDTVYGNVDQLPEFIGGYLKRQEFVKNNIDCRITEKLNKIVYVVIYFICKKDGTLSAFYIDKAPMPYGIEINANIENQYKNEALRIIKKFPKLIPGKLNGQNVNTISNFIIELENCYN